MNGRCCYPHRVLKTDPAARLHGTDRCGAAKGVQCSLQGHAREDHQSSPGAAGKNMSPGAGEAVVALGGGSHDLVGMARYWSMGGPHHM
jgi:hypothetical protein